jgi:hypothetical protein
MNKPTFPTPAFVQHARRATAAEFYQLNHDALSNPAHPRHLEASSDLRALTIAESGDGAHQPYVGNGFVS